MHAYLGEVPQPPAGTDGVVVLLPLRLGRGTESRQAVADGVDVLDAHEPEGADVAPDVVHVLVPFAGDLAGVCTCESGCIFRWMSDNARELAGRVVAGELNHPKKTKQKGAIPAAFVLDGSPAQTPPRRRRVLERTASYRHMACKGTRNPGASKSRRPKPEPRWRDRRTPD